MALRVAGILFDELTADPGTPANGQAWFNTTENRFKIYRNGAVQSLVDLQEHIDHRDDLTNPHAIDLEDARTSGNTFAGPVDMGSNKITSLSQPTTGGDAAEFQWVLDQIKAKIQGLDWKESVLDKDLATPPVTPAQGDRYIIAAGATGAWLTHAGKVTEWDGAAWTFVVPNEGACVRVEDENKQYIHDGTSWGLWETSQDHGNLVGLADDDHTIYMLVTGARAMTGGLDMGTNAITNVGLVDGVDVSAHAARHITGGADEVDGDKLDIDWNPTNYTPTVAPTEVDSLDNLTAHLAGIDAELAGVGTHLVQKAGSALAASFAGSPKKITITFSAAFADANYAVTLASVTTNNTTYNPAVESKTASSFVINLGLSGITNLTSVDWVAMKHGEA